ncbi:hypothetical protein M0R45_013710 [Rubus argutus]|uniref:RSE1/DDB1/CPSF1 C-terminal domain-containing protein n=1 Tax=Rubus argutus TaxID=59490 RepID=A0AAW1XKI2_RUBAR
MKSISLLIYKHEEGAIEERARDYNANWMSAVEILDDDVYLGAENFYNLFTVRKNSEDSDVGQIPTVIFGTVNGVIGVIASLPQEHYAFLEKLQTNLRKVIKGVGGLSHEQWSRGKMDEISLQMSVPVEELCKRVEELTRLH